MEGFEKMPLDALGFSVLDKRYHDRLVEMSCTLFYAIVAHVKSRMTELDQIVEILWVSLSDHVEPVTRRFNHVRAHLI